MAFCLFGLQWIMLKRVIDMFAAWKNSFCRHINIAFWKAVSHCIMWCLWLEWNSRSFEGRERTILELKPFSSFSSMYYPFRYI